MFCISAGGFTCGCKPGYAVDPTDPNKCIDVNECLINNGGCRQECINNGNLIISNSLNMRSW